MILPIVAYGAPVLRKNTEDITADYPNLKELLENMYETMYNANGVGLAAPQVNLPIRILVIDAKPFEEEYPEAKDFKKAFINLHIIEEEGEEWAFEEGCLSVPGINEMVERKPKITVEYDDENFVHHKETYEGILARIIQHEGDHLNGKLFTDHLSPLRRTMLRKRLENITKGDVKVSYKMSFPNQNKKR